MKRKYIDKFILIVAICVFIYAAINLFQIFKANHDEKRETDKVRDIINAPTEEKELDNFSVNFDELKAINPEVVAWVVVKDTSISYPIVKGQNNEYYLNHTFEKKENYAGSIFMDHTASPDFSDLNTFIYGHNVYHGTMFAELSNYVNESFFNKHPYVYLYTPTGNYKLRVVSAYVADAQSDSYRMSFSSTQDYQNYLNTILAKSRYDSKAVMSAEDRMVTLYTCSYENGETPENTDSEYINDRYFVHCKIIKELAHE